MKEEDLEAWHVEFDRKEMKLKTKLSKLQEASSSSSGSKVMSEQDIADWEVALDRKEEQLKLKEHEMFGSTR